MEPHQIMQKVADILTVSKTGVLATVDGDGSPRMRWMSPVLIKGRPGVIFAVTSPVFCKVGELCRTPVAEWMIQTPALDQIVNLRGKVNVIDSPALRREVIENLGGNLMAFWQINKDVGELVVIETIIEEAVYYQPMKGVKQKVKF